MAKRRKLSVFQHCRPYTFLLLYLPSCTNLGHLRVIQYFDRVRAMGKKISRCLYCGWNVEPFRIAQVTTRVDLTPEMHSLGQTLDMNVLK
jgi:hypothetical protein